MIWLSNGFADNPNDGGLYREGLIRINVLGRQSHVLLKRKHELAWTVTYSTNMNPVYGVTKIEIKPGVTEMSNGVFVAACFGSLVDGCSFDPVPSLQKAGIKIKKLCDRESIVGYRLSYPGKRDTLIQAVHNSGAAWTDSTIYLLFDVPAAELCDQPMY